jgi:hypothetical protein
MIERLRAAWRALLGRTPEDDVIDSGEPVIVRVKWNGDNYREMTLTGVRGMQVVAEYHRGERTSIVMVHEGIIFPDDRPLFNRFLEREFHNASH